MPSETPAVAPRASAIDHGLEPDTPGATEAAPETTAYDLASFHLHGELGAQTETVFAPGVPPAPRPRSFAPFVWGGLGFISGMLAWHVVGFWTFVSDVVLNDTTARVVAVAPAATPAPPRKAVTSAPQPAAIAAPARCVTLSIDRANGITETAPCSENDVALRDAGFTRRTDRVAAHPRLQDPKAWSNTTAVESSSIETGSMGTGSTGASSIETGTLKETDFNLNLDR